MSQKFTTVVMPCKPLVRNYLENNFGRPVSIPEQHFLKKHACALLMKKNGRGNPPPDYTASIQIVLDFNDFRYDGHNIDIKNIVYFNNSVDRYIKELYRSNLDALLISQQMQVNWKKRFEDLLKFTRQHANPDKESLKKIRELRAELEDHEISIQKAIETVVYDFLHLDFDVLPFETIKKDYFRYRQKKSIPELSSHIN